MKLQSPKSADILPEPPPTLDLTKAITNAAEYSTITLPNGIYPVRCDGTVKMPRGLHIKGSGPRTIIQRDNRPEWAANNQPVLWSGADDITIEDVTLDANGSDTDAYAHYCLHLFGRSCTVRNVRGIRASGLWTDAWKVECFAFFITGQDSLVSHCRVEQVTNTYVEAFSVNGICELCHVEYPPLASNAHPPFLNGYQFSGTSGAIFDRCTQYGGNGFFYTDTGSDSNVTITNCRAVNVHQGIIVVRQPGQFIDGLIVDSNIIELSPTAFWGDGANGIAISGAGEKRNIRLTNNLVRYVGGVRGPVGNVGRLCAVGVFEGSIGTIIRDNVIDADLTALARNSDGTDTLGAVVVNNTPMARAIPAPEP